MIVLRCKQERNFPILSLILFVISQGEQLGGRLDGLVDRMDEVEDVRLPALEAQG